MTAQTITVGGGEETVVSSGGSTNAGTFDNSGTVWGSSSLQGFAEETSSEIGDIGSFTVVYSSIVAAINSLNSLNSLSDLFDSIPVSASSSLDSNLQTFTLRMKTEFETFRTMIGGTTTSDVSGLLTTSTDLVGAINEVLGTVSAMTAVSSVNGVAGPGAITIDSDDVTEGSSNLYFTEARALSSVLTGFVSSTGTVASTDTVLQAIGKIDANTTSALSRSSHTGTQLASTISDFTETAQDAIGAALVDGSIVYDDTLNTIARAALTGDVTCAQGSNTTSITAGVIADSHVSTTAAILASKIGLLTGLSSTSVASVAATDTLLDAIGKLSQAMPVGSVLSAAFSSTSTTRSNVTGWSIPVVNGASYEIRVIATYQTAATTTGGSLGLGVVGASGNVNGSVKGALSAAAVATGLAGPMGSTSAFLTTTGVSAINTPHYFEMTIIFQCTASGTLTIQWGSEVAGSAAQINAGSAMIYSRIA